MLCSCNSGQTAAAAGKQDSAQVSSTQDTSAKEARQSEDTTKRYIYLTFDDGPQNGSRACIAAINNEHVKGTFFVIGAHVFSPKLKEIVTEEQHAYPTILMANHSFTHAADDRYRYFYNHPSLVLSDIDKNQKFLDCRYKIVRLPGNSAWVRQGEFKAHGMVKNGCLELQKNGYSVIGWDLEWSFNHHNADPVQSPQQMANMVVNALEHHHCHTRNHVVILSHDRMFRDPAYAAELTQFIRLLKAHPNYVFETIDQYPGVVAEK